MWRGWGNEMSEIGETPTRSWIWSRNTILGFRGVPRLSVLPISPFSSSPYSALPTNTRRFETTEMLGIGEGAGERRKREERKCENTDKSGIWRRNPPYGSSVGFRGLPWRSAVARFAHLSIPLSPRLHIPPFRQIPDVSKPPKC